MPYVTSPQTALPTLTEADVPDIHADLTTAGIDTAAFEIVQSVSGNVWFGVREPGRPGLNMLLDIELLNRMAEVLDAAGWEIAAHPDGKRVGGLELVGRVPRVGQHVTVPTEIAPNVENRTAEVIAVGDETLTVRFADDREQQVATDAVVPRLWTVEQAAAFLGVQPASARGTLSRWKVPARTYRQGPTGRTHALYVSTEVRAAAANRPGRGARTDLREEAPDA